MRASLTFVTALSFVLFSSFSQNVLSQSVREVAMQGKGFRQPLNVEAGANTLQLCNLETGRTYMVVAVGAVDGQNAVFTMTMEDDAAEKKSQTISWPDRPNQRLFVAEQGCATLHLDVKVAASGPEGVPMSLSATCADCTEEPSWLEKFQEKAERAMNLTTTGNLTADSLIKGTLIGGDCFEVSGITSAGNVASRGIFSNGGASIDIAEGLVLCTGNVNVLPGPNMSPNINGGFATNTVEDADLSSIIGGNQFDLAKIEFDFVPTSDMIQFDYVFGSEEYCEYVGSQYNDVFGFFISGPGISGSQNIALIPGTNAPITINAVNHVSNNTYYVNNNNFNPCQGQPVKAVAFNQLDGWTVRLTAMAQVIPCETYHIKLAIADVADAIYSSAVFLKANSFNAGDKVVADAVYPSGQDFVYEDCGNGFIRFVRTGDTTQAFAMAYTVSDSSTAIPGIDYEALPDSIFFGVGQTEVLIPIHVFADSLEDDFETIIIQLENTCECEDLEMEVLIYDKPPLEIVLDSIAVCEDAEAVLTPTVTGGIGAYNYQWFTGETTPSINITGTGTNVCTLTVTDGCGTTTTAETGVTLLLLPTAELTGETLICTFPADTADLMLSLTGDGPWMVAFNNNGVSDSLLVASSPVVVPVMSAGSYALTGVVSTYGCIGSAIGSVSVDAVTVNLELTPTDPACFGGGNGSIEANPGGGFGPFTYAWSDGSTGPVAGNLTAGDYTVTVTNAEGCMSEASQTLSEPSLLTANVVGFLNINCTYPLGNADLEVSGGTPGYTYVWSNNAVLQDPVFSSGGNYLVTVTDGHNCTAATSVFIASNTTLPDAVIEPALEMTCLVPVIALSGNGSSTGSSFDYAWTTNEGQIDAGATSLTPVISAPGVYQLLVTDNINGCTQTATLTVTQNTTAPQVNAGPAAVLTCKDTTLQLSGWGAGGVEGVSFTWSGPGIIGGTDVSNPEINAAGVYILTVTDLYNGCTATSSTQVGMDVQAPVAEAGNGFELTCTVEEGNLNAAGSSAGPNFLYTWSTPDGNILNGAHTAEPLVDAAGVYALLVLNTENGCSASDVVTILQNVDMPTFIDWYATMPACGNQPGSVMFESVTGGVGPFLYSINNGAVFQTAEQFTGLTPGNYNLVVQDANGCEHAQTMQLPVPVEPNVELPPTIQLSFGDSTLITATLNIPLSEVDTILWSPMTALTLTDDPTVVLAQPFNNIQYTVTVVNNDGCEAEAVVRVLVENPNIWAPNVISSGNQDGLNDHFLLFATPGSVYEINSLQVYDRWGGLLFFNEHFQPNQERSGWNGTFRGKTLNAGVYVWWAQVELINGDKVILKGDVTIAD
ncbi:MAG: choice-of-anchor L domain-containing protein [Saprospiraceae bacterium]|nr:choice-of-anchor L domain-containing protein [Saprospiraceae bacterium]